MGDKKGVSSVITTLLIIVVALVAVVIVWGVVKNVSDKTKERAVLDVLLIDLDIQKVTFNQSESLATIWIKRNKGEGNLVGVRFILTNGYHSQVYDENTTMQELGSQVFPLTYNDSLSEIYVSPIIELSSGERIYGEVLEYYKYAEPSALFLNFCGNDICNEGEDAQWCGKWNGLDCDPVCGNSVCESSAGETIINCIVDCYAICGNLNCESPYENSSNCAGDCPIACGNSICETGENNENCHGDCLTAVCGNTVCESTYGGENSSNCAGDCPVICGNSICETGEFGVCHQDCPYTLSFENLGYSGFESGTQGWTFGGVNSERSSVYSMSKDDGLVGGSYSAHIQDDVTNSYFYKSFNLSGGSFISMKFYYRIVGFEGYEYTEILCDGNQVWNFTCPGTCNYYWTLNTINITNEDCVFDESVMIKFNRAGQGSDDDAYFDGINLTVARYVPL
ncbi:MAG: archaellin/type IV pilin N-terminal domain-containing protein [Candidatus Pacearchaeota archaeon]|jgi:hypothetical protein